MHRVRDLGGVLFIDIRDREGVSQVVFRDNDALLAQAKKLRPEFVVGVKGLVERRSPETVNPKLATGDVEVLARELRLLNEAKTPPFQIAEDSPVSEDVRLQVPLSRPAAPAPAGRTSGCGTKWRLPSAKQFNAQGFWEIETPILTKSTPEGARDYLVPSRVHPGEFYALPQSPQIFKQILMIGGMDRYFQITRCFRDEDLRADRQPEFTQVDVEMSFASPDLIYALIEPVLQRIFACIGKALPAPFRRMPYAEAMAKYGSDKPDLRCGMEIHDVSAAFADSEFRVFKQIVADGGVIRGFAVPGGNRYTRNQIDGLVDQAKQIGFGGLIWVRPGEPPTSSVKALSEGSLRAAISGLGANADDLVLLAGGPPDHTSSLLGQLRLAVAKRDESARSGEVRGALGDRLPAARVERGGWTVVFHAPPLHLAAGRGHGQARERSGFGAGQGLRPRAQRQRDWRRQHSYPRRRDAGANLPHGSASATRRPGRASGFSSKHWSTARRRMAGSPSASTESSPSWPTNRRSVRSSRSRKRRPRSTSWLTLHRQSIRSSSASST